LIHSGGRIVFTDPLVLTGAVSASEIGACAVLGSNLFVTPPGLNEAAIKSAGLITVDRQNRASAVAEIGARWQAARLRHAVPLKQEEGEEWFERRQRMLATSAELAASGRLSRFLYVAEKTSAATPG
jgi:hypothetical protein